MLKNLLKIGLAVTVLVSISIVIGVANKDKDGKKTETLTIAMVPTEINAMLYVAEDQKFFTRNGLSVAFRENYESGAVAANGMLNGEADIALAAEFPIVKQIFSKKNIVNFGTVTRYENTYIIWKSDSGIKKVGDLKGKKIGVTLQTISEFYLGRTLNLNGTDIKQVTLVNIKAAEAENALMSGEVNAVVTWEPWVTKINQRLGKEVAVTNVQSGQYAYWNLVSTPSWIDNNPSAIKKLMKSLTLAESYIASHQDEARAIVGRRLSLDSELMEDIWERDQFSLFLDQSIILAMEDEARWLIKNNLTGEKTVPDFLDHIYEDGLKMVKPEAANIIR